MRSPRRARRSALMARPPASEDARSRAAPASEITEQHDGHRRRADRVVALDLPEDVDRRHLGVERDVARRRARPSRTRRPRARSSAPRPTGSPARGWAGRSRRKIVVERRAQRRRRLLHLAVELHARRAGPSARRTAASRTAAPSGSPSVVRDDVDADRRRRARQSASRMIPTTIVGSAKGRSMSALTTPPCRGSRSRTSTHAVARARDGVDRRDDQRRPQRQLQRRRPPGGS